MSVVNRVRNKEFNGGIETRREYLLNKKERPATGPDINLETHDRRFIGGESKVKESTTIPNMADQETKTLGFSSNRDNKETHKVIPDTK